MTCVFHTDAGVIFKIKVTYLSVTFVLPELHAHPGGFTGSPHKNTLTAQLRNTQRATAPLNDIAASTPSKRGGHNVRKSVIH
jgi:hypothetical protein